MLASRALRRAHATVQREFTRDMKVMVGVKVCIFIPAVLQAPPRSGRLTSCVHHLRSVSSTMQ